MRPLQFYKLSQAEMSGNALQEAMQRLAQTMGISLPVISSESGTIFDKKIIHSEHEEGEITETEIEPSQRSSGNLIHHEVPKKKNRKRKRKTFETDELAIMRARQILSSGKKSKFEKFPRDLNLNESSVDSTKVYSEPDIIGKSSNSNRHAHKQKGIRNESKDSVSSKFTDMKYIETVVGDSQNSKSNHKSIQSETNAINRKNYKNQLAADTRINSRVAIKTSSSSQPKVPCRYWMEGRCSKGDLCTFSHALKPNKTVEEAKSTTEVCKFHIAGCCLKGDDCLYSHDLSRVPCKFFHVHGECTAHMATGGCRFSHAPITDVERYSLFAETTHIRDPRLHSTPDPNVYVLKTSEEVEKPHFDPLVAKYAHIMSPEVAVLNPFGNPFTSRL